MTEHPSDGELRAASANLMVGRLRDDMQAQLAATWRGRLAWRLANWTAAARKPPESPLRIFDCRNGIPPFMQATIDQKQHVHGFDHGHGFCLFGQHGTVKLNQGPQASGWQHVDGTWQGSMGSPSSNERTGA